MSGRLYIVATPIGNLGDISQRACETLESVELILAEDTRHSSKLLSHLGIKKPLQSLHEHNESERTGTIIEQLLQGKSIALISDAGTPLISDPGFPLVREAGRQHIPVIPIPGPSALLAALSVSGLPCERFVFEGFLPARSSARQKYLKTLVTETRTMIFYESPHRITVCINDMASIFGADRPAVIARELTKTHEQVERSSLAGLSEWLSESDNHRKGEIVVLVAGNEHSQPRSMPDTDAILTALLKYIPLKEAAKLTAELTGEARNQLYRQALEIRAKKNDR